MGIGGAILLMALGAILAFAVDYQFGVIDITVVGWVLMLAGLAILVITLSLYARRRRPTTVVEERVVERPAGTVVYDDPARPGYDPRPPV